MRKILYTQPDGVLVLVHPVRNTREDLADSEVEKRAWDRLPADAIAPQFIGESAVPADRTFRNAWKAGDARIEHDMEKCRAIQRARLRLLRAPKLACLDVEFQRSYKDPARLDAIEAEKQILRDVTKDPSIEAAKTPEELKLAVPAVLSEP